MTICTQNHALWTELSVVAALDDSKESQKDRIRMALGVIGDRTAEVNEETLLRYYQYLSGKLSFPFLAHYPHPTNAREQSEFCCRVLGLCDPVNHFGDVFDGIFCRIRKGKYELKLPVIELELPQDHPNSQLIEDYWYWFWNWR